MSLDSIVQASTGAMDMVQRIAAATEEQSAATEEVTQSMESISTIARKSAESTAQIKVSAEELARTLDLPAATVLAALFELEAAGIAVAAGGGRYGVKR